MTDDELAFIIGHEVGHRDGYHAEKKLASRVAKRAALRHELGKLDDHLQQKGSGKIKRAAAHVICRALGEAGVALSGQLESQHYETKADERGMEIAEAAGYDPEASVTAYEKLHGGRVPEVGLIQGITSSHPAPRIRHQQLAEKSKNRRDNE
jgi:putative metalloprotease